MGQKKVSKVGKVSKVSKEWQRKAFGTFDTFGTFGTSIFGFTVVELLIAVSIVVMLATLALTNFVAQLPKGRDVKRKDNLSQTRRALEDYSTDEKAGCYPSSLPSCGQRFEKGGKVYLPSVPCDPRTNQPYLYSPTPAGSCPASYWLYATLENKSDLDIPKVGCIPTDCPGMSGYNFRLGSPNAQ